MQAPHIPVPFAVTHVDGSIERFSLKALSITDLYKWLYLSKDNSEPAMVALCTGKDLAWVDSLELDSFAALAAKCSEINFPLAVGIAKKGAPVAAALLAPLMQRALLSAHVTITLSRGSGEPSSTPAPSGSAGETSSASPMPIRSTVSAP